MYYIYIHTYSILMLVVKNKEIEANQHVTRSNLNSPTLRYVKAQRCDCTIFG